MKKYLVMGGDVMSNTDGQRHYVSADRLVQLYRIDPQECVLHDRGDLPLLRVQTQGLIQLRPRTDGCYDLNVLIPTGKSLCDQVRAMLTTDILPAWGIDHLFECNGCTDYLQVTVEKVLSNHDHLIHRCELDAIDHTGEQTDG